MEYVKYKWAIRALNPRNTSEKKSIDHAHAGIGYFILSAPTDSQKFYVVGYKHLGGDLNAVSDWANQYQVETLEAMNMRRYSLEQK